MMVFDSFRPIFVTCELLVCDTAQVFGVFRQFLSTCSEQNAPARTPINVQGTEIIRMSINDILCPDNILSNATVAAEIGLAVIAC